MSTPVTEGIPPKIVKQTEELSCELTPLEWNNRATEFADAQKAAEEQEERKKMVMADMNADLKTAKLKVSKLARTVANHRETREVTVQVTYNYDEGIVTKVRTDTNEEVSRREMTTQEKQSELELMDANNFIESRHEEGQSDGLEQKTGAAKAPEKSPKK